MKYWEEYQSKWGFGDGDSMPPDAWQIRYVYCYAFNVMAEALGSKNRLVPLDRPGMHNCYLLRFGTAECQGKLTHDAFAKGPWNGDWEQPNSHWDADTTLDVAGQRAEEWLQYESDGSIDDFVNRRNQIRKTDLKRWLASEIKKMKAKYEENVPNPVQTDRRRRSPAVDHPRRR